MGLGGFGWCWVGLGGFGWAWVSLGGFGWVWVGLGGLVWYWVCLGELGWVWVGLGEFEWVWVGCGGGDHNSLSQRSAIANNVPGYRGQKGSMKRYSLGALEIIDQADCAKTKT